MKTLPISLFALVLLVVLVCVLYPTWSVAEVEPKDPVMKDSPQNPDTQKADRPRPVRGVLASEEATFYFTDERGGVLSDASLWLDSVAVVGAQKLERTLLGRASDGRLLVAVARLRAALHGGYVSVVGKHAGHRPDRRSLSSIGLEEAGSQPQVTFVLRACEQQLFRFRDHRGRPLEGQTVVISEELAATFAPSPVGSESRASGFRAEVSSGSDGIARVCVLPGKFFMRVLPHGEYGVHHVSVDRASHPLRMPAAPIDLELWPLYAAGLAIKGDTVVTGRCDFKHTSFKNAGQGQLDRVVADLSRKWSMGNSDSKLVWVAFPSTPDAEPMARAVVLLKRTGWQTVEVAMQPVSIAKPRVLDATLLPAAKHGVLELRWSHGKHCPMYQLRSLDVPDEDGALFVQRIVTGPASLSVPPGRYVIRGMLGNDRIVKPKKTVVKAGEVTVVSLDPPPHVGIVRLDIDVPSGLDRQNLRLDLSRGNAVVDRRFLPSAKMHLLFVKPERYIATLRTPGCVVATKELIVHDMSSEGAVIVRWKATLQLAGRGR